MSYFTGRWVGGWGCGVGLVGEVIDWNFVWTFLYSWNYLPAKSVYMAWSVCTQLPPGYM